ncbi:ATP-binding cassette domain-containing protein [Macrococcoides canis]|uniref:amino acid ABC transporter ATP-binding/permease protein n=1 Tax=Macrococcoides canis TaxID=1855823 RepID=UPI001AEC5ABE|nr:ATP-binding cassette domain-containing protein [Macrococcus canis]QTQ08721.1 ATP-binding cassette domain-containing protein [Macrococcus canis]
MMRWMNEWVNRSIVLSIIIGLLGALTSIGMFSLSGLMLSKSVLNVPLYTLIVLVATIKLFGVVRAICKYFERLISHEATFEMLKNIRVSTVRTLLENFEHIQSDYKLSDVLNRTVNNIEKLQNKLLRVIYPPIIALLTTLTVILIYIQYSMYAVIVIAITMMIMIIVLPNIFAKQLEVVVQNKYEATARYENKLMDYQLHRETIQIFDEHHRFEQQLNQLQEQMEASIAKENKVITMYDFLLNAIAMTAIFLTLTAMLADPSLTRMMYLSLVMVTITLFEMSIPMVHYPYHKAESKRAEDEISQLDYVKVKKINTAFESLRLNNVSVKKKGLILDGIDLEVTKGQRIGIAGRSGSGKTTLAHTILGLNQLDGTYRLNDEPIALPVDMLSMWNIATQDNHFIEGTIAENMFISVSDEKLEELLLHFNLPFKAQSAVEAFGENLSGGEKKRLHFIRMILRNKPLWLLDEPFNGVDNENIEIMMSYLKRNKITLILISHDTELLQEMDEIIVMDAGKIVERGTFQQLYKNKSTLFNALSEV